MGSRADAGWGGAKERRARRRRRDGAVKDAFRAMRGNLACVGINEETAEGP